jgi:hypothetical protein
MTTARTLLLEAMGEEEFAQQVKRWARRYGWHGRHVRYSVGVVEGVHTTRIDGHSDAHGALDWEFWHVEKNRYLQRELKTQKGRVTRDQTRTIAELKMCGINAKVWRPSDEAEILATFRAED